jgi:hypothetical protein
MVFTITPISTTQTITSRFNSLNTKNTTTYDVGNPGPGEGQTQKTGYLYPNPPLLMIGSPPTIHI